MARPRGERACRSTPLVRGRFVMRNRTLMPDAQAAGAARSTRSSTCCRPRSAPRRRDDGGDRTDGRGSAADSAAMTGAHNSVRRQYPIRRRPSSNCEQATVTYGGGERAVHALAQTSLRMGKRRLRRPGGPVRLRQVDHPQARQRADPRIHRPSSSSPDARSVRRGAGRHGIPEPDPAAVDDDPRQRHAAAQDRAAVPRAIPAASARPSFATAPRRCSPRSDWPASATSIPGSCRAA